MSLTPPIASTERCPRIVCTEVALSLFKMPVKNCFILNMHSFDEYKLYILFCALPLN